MPEEMERLVALYDRGALSRRQLLQGLVALGVGARPSGPPAAQAAPVFNGRTINHVTIMVSDVARSKAFYQRLAGLSVRDEGKDYCELRLDRGFLGLYKADRGDRRGINHFCLGVDGFEPKTALAAVTAAEPGAEPTLENSTEVYTRDPDGVRVQFADVRYKS